MASREDFVVYNVATIGSHERGKELRMMVLKALSSMFAPKAVAFDHFVRIRDMNSTKS